MNEFRKLPDSYSVTGIEYKLIKRCEKAAIYIHKGEKNFSCEVFCVRKAKESKMVFDGVETIIPSREKIPSNEDFGSWAWCINNSDESKLITNANKIYQEILDGIRPRSYETEK